MSKTDILAELPKLSPNVRHCEGGLPTAAIHGELQMDRHVAALLAMTGMGSLISSRNGSVFVSALAATKQSIQLDRHALAPHARDDRLECEIFGLTVLANFARGIMLPLLRWRLHLLWLKP